MRADRFGLCNLIEPILREDFFSNYYEAQLLHVDRRGTSGHFSDLLGLDDVDRIITMLDVRYPDVSLVAADRDIKADHYTLSGRTLDVARLYQLHAGGATVVLNRLHRYHMALADLCAAMELEFSAPFQTNVYLTPPRAKGFKAHFDTHDVFVLQVCGTKRWRFFESPIRLPLSGQDDAAVLSNPGPPIRELNLKAGDTLYIPRGLVHDAAALDDTSLHLTVGMLSYTWVDLLLEAFATTTLNNPLYRRSLPPGFAQATFDRTEPRRTFRALLKQFSESADFDGSLDAFASELVRTRRPRLIGQMRQLAKLEHLSEDSVLAPRPSLAYSLHEDGSSIRIRCYGNEIQVPIVARVAVQFALTTQRFCVRDLPGSLDQAGKLVLVRRFVREGILTIE